MIRHAGTEFYARDGKPAKPEDHWLFLAYQMRQARAPFLSREIHLAAAEEDIARAKLQPRHAQKAVAQINHGRWLANCPDPTCNGAELIHLDNPAFFCGSCLNAKWGGALLDVEMPNPAFIQPILDLLELRVDTRLQQWQPGWTLEQIQDLHLSFTTPYTWTTGEVVTAAKLNTSAGRDNESALDATFDRLLAQIGKNFSGTQDGTFTNGITQAVTVNNASDKILAWGAWEGGSGTGAERRIRIRDNTDALNGDSFGTTSTDAGWFAFALFFGVLSVGSHTIQLQYDLGGNGTVAKQHLLAWVIPANV